MELNCGDEENYFRYLLRRNPLSYPFRRLMYRRYCRWLRGRVLDVGCGLGEFIQYYEDAVGVDMNFYATRYCLSKGLNVTCGNACSLPFRNGSFDSALLDNVLEHLAEPETCMDEVLRVLSDQGRVVIVLPDSRAYAKDPSHRKFWKPGEIRELLQLKSISVERVSFFPIPWRALGRFFSLNSIVCYGQKRLARRPG